MLLSFKLPSIFGWGREVRLIRYGMWWTLHSCWNKHKPFRILWRDAKFQGLHVAQFWGMLIWSPFYLGRPFWKTLIKMALVLSFSLPFLIWLFDSCFCLLSLLCQS